MNEQPTAATGTESPSAPSSGSGAYQVLARKYRPGTFADLIGQEAMVRTLTNAIRSGRLAHAFMLTGVRGIGKTTTARIIARALNCIGPDGSGGPTAEPCGLCEPCRGIAEDRHVDVMEMDAASRTGVDDIREIIDGVRYRPTSARFKVYIIDEVHMLSRNAFNALLKTLEEPPEHTKFIFATTEIRKVPVTVLSRCQRFDLRRVDMETLAAHFAAIAGKEAAAVDPAALSLIARAADGSVRDGLSLLDQAISHTGGTVGEADVRDMLGLVDRERTFDLFDALMQGDMAAALDQLGDLYAAGADPALVLEDLLELTHWLTRIKLVPEAADRAGVPEAERTRGRDMAARLSMAALTRNWQMLLKGLEETRFAPSVLQAAEMVLVRLVYAANLPSPADAVRALDGAPAGTAAPASSAASSAASSSDTASSASAAAPPADAAAPAAPAAPGGDTRPQAGAAPGPVASRGETATRAALAEQPQASDPETEAPPDPPTFEAVAVLAEAHREGMLSANLRHNVHLVRFEPGRIEFRPAAEAPSTLANDLSNFLNDHTGRRWMVSVSEEPGAATLRQKADAEMDAAKASARENPLVQSVLETFPGAEIATVRSLAPADEADDDHPEDADPDDFRTAEDDGED